MGAEPYLTVAVDNVVFVVGRHVMLAVVAAGATTAAATAAVSDPRLDLNVAVGRQLVKATPGSSCLGGRVDSKGRDGRCVDAKYPLRTAGRLVLAPGKQLRMRAGAPVGEADVRLLAEGYASDPPVYEGAAVIQRDPRRLRFTLPRRLPCAKIVDVVVYYADGVANFWAAVKTPRCVRVDPEDEEARRR